MYNVFYLILSQLNPVDVFVSFSVAFSFHGVLNQNGVKKVLTSQVNKNYFLS